MCMQVQSLLALRMLSTEFLKQTRDKIIARSEPSQRGKKTQHYYAQHEKKKHAIRGAMYVLPGPTISLNRVQFPRKYSRGPFTPPVSVKYFALHS